MRFPLQTSAILLGVALRGVSAGAEAYINACIYLAQKPAQPFSIQWTAGNNAADRCLYDRGHDATMTVTDSGLTCSSVGKVQAKASSSGGDLCATDDSIWGISYNGGKNNVYSGSTLSKWTSEGFFLSKARVTLRQSSKDTNICADRARCSGTDVYWQKSNTPNLYIIFHPVATNVQANSALVNLAGSIAEDVEL